MIQGDVYKSSSFSHSQLEKGELNYLQLKCEIE